ncbi:hypothetical protein ACFL6P_01235 [Candidatus Latescibacterota bacterium]
MEKRTMDSYKLFYFMKKMFLLLLVIMTFACQSSTPKFPTDLSNVRGFNYTPALAKGHTDCWVNYKPEVIEYDLDLAIGLNLNQCRTFLPIQAWEQDRDGLAGKLEHFFGACSERGIGVMVVVGYRREWTTDTSTLPEAREWAEYLVETLADKEGLEFWDVMNEPDWPTDEEIVDRECEYAAYMSGVFRELDPNTPVTIGMAFVPGMERMAEYMDVLSYHDYSQTRGAVRREIARANAFADSVGKPVFGTEIGRICLSNPYDVTLEEHMNAKMGWYIWELMIVREGWGHVQGVFYEDGSVRDPSIPAAIMGYFRYRGPNILPSDPDNSNWVTQVIDWGRAWMDSASVENIEVGLDLAETGANLIESGELASMRIPPNQRIAMLRAGEPDLEATRAILTEFIEIIEPYRIGEE